MTEELELAMNEDGELGIVEEKTKVSFYLDEDGIFEFLKAIRANKEIGDLIEGIQLSIDGVSDEFLVRLQTLK